MEVLWGMKRERGGEMHYSAFKFLNSARKTQDRMKSKDTVPEKNRSIETLTGSLSFVAWKTIVL